jgi:hypothetical protein
LLISSPFKTLREKLAPKNLVFREKNALCKKPISENLENRRKTTMGVLEKGKITSENTTVSQEFVKSEEWRVESGAWIVKREQGTADRGSEIGEEKRMNDEC